MSTWVGQYAVDVNNWIGNIDKSTPTCLPGPMSPLEYSTALSELEGNPAGSRKRTRCTGLGQLQEEPPQKRLHRQSQSDSSLEEQYCESTPEMNQDTASAGSSRSVLSNRPILTPKAPSRRSSTSPIRTILASLRSAIPAVDICQPGPAATATPSKTVESLKSFLLDGYDKAFIPKELEVHSPIPYIYIYLHQLYAYLWIS
jgi:hypothetical protein